MNKIHVEKLEYAKKIIFHNGDYLILNIGEEVLEKLIETEKDLNKDNFLEKLENFDVKKHFKYVIFSNEFGTSLVLDGDKWVTDKASLGFSNDDRDHERFGYVDIKYFPDEIKANTLANVYYYYKDKYKVVYKVEIVGEYNPIIEDYQAYEKYCKFKYDTWGT